MVAEESEEGTVLSRSGRLLFGPFDTAGHFLGAFERNQEIGVLNVIKWWFCIFRRLDCDQEMLFFAKFDISGNTSEKGKLN